MNKMMTFVAASVLAASASVAMANQTSGFYAGVLAGYGMVDYTGDVVYKNHGIDGGVNAGYMATPNFGAEVGFIQYSEVKLSDNQPAITQNYNMYAAGVAKLDLTSEFNVFAKLGLARVHSKVNSTDLTIPQGGVAKYTLFAGAGVGYFVMPNIQLSFEGDMTTKSSNIPGMLSSNIGLTYVF
jgi:hypothetical protein